MHSGNKEEHQGRNVKKKKMNKRKETTKKMRKINMQWGKEARTERQHNMRREEH